MKKMLYGLLFVLLMSACHTSKKMNTENQNTMPSPERLTPLTPISSPVNMSSPPVFIYKTTGDYYYNVPIIMNNERTKIVSYPAPVDLIKGNGLRLPTRLVDGYLLDNKGIGPNVAFLSYTYEEYSKMADAPTMDELMSHIINKHPLAVWHTCGRWNDYTDIVPQLNELIEKEYMQK